MFWLKNIYDDYINLDQVSYLFIDYHKLSIDSSLYRIIARLTDSCEVVIDHFATETEARKKLKQIMDKLQEAQ